MKMSLIGCHHFSHSCWKPIPPILRLGAIWGAILRHFATTCNRFRRSSGKRHQTTCGCPPPHSTGRHTEPSSSSGGCCREDARARRSTTLRVCRKRGFPARCLQSVSPLSVRSSTRPTPLARPRSRTNAYFLPNRFNAGVLSLPKATDHIQVSSPLALSIRTPRQLTFCSITRSSLPKSGFSTMPVGTIIPGPAGASGARTFSNLSPARRDWYPRNGWSRRSSPYQRRIIAATPQQWRVFPRVRIDLLNKPQTAISASIGRCRLAATPLFVSPHPGPQNSSLFERTSVSPSLAVLSWLVSRRSP